MRDTLLFHHAQCAPHQKYRDARKLFMDGYREALVRLKPEKVLFFGDVPDGYEGNIERYDAFYKAVKRPSHNSKFVDSSAKESVLWADDGSSHRAGGGGNLQNLTTVDQVNQWLLESELACAAQPYFAEWYRHCRRARHCGGLQAGIR